MNSRSSCRVLVVGGTGMLGHKVWQLFQRRFDAWVTIRTLASPASRDLFPGERTISDVRVDDFDSVVRACAAARPEVVVNCAGIVKQLKAGNDPLPSLTVNALFPHRAAALCEAIGARFIQVSTDCVFRGLKGGYTETDPPDATDLYGRTKLLGEVSSSGCLTLRTSIVGRELCTTTGLLEWLLSHRGGRVQGYRRALFSGVTTETLASLLASVVEDQQTLEGVYHVASEPITKYDLLCRISEAFDAGIQIDPTDDVRIDRTLNGSRFREATGLSVPGWDHMIRAMAMDTTPYDKWRPHV